MTKNVALALGGGGAKGFAHFGVAEVLRANDYQFTAISGTSAGGIAGAMIALGFSKKDFSDALDTIDRSQMFIKNPTDRKSLLGLNGLEILLRKFIGHKTFEELEIPFAVTAVNMDTQEEIIINSGPLVPAIMATSSVPGLFPPNAYPDIELVDGGVMDPVPVSVARWLAPNTPIIAVCLNPEQKNWKDAKKFEIPAENRVSRLLLDTIKRTNLIQLIQVTLDAFETSQHLNAELRLKLEKPDLIIRPKVHAYTMMDFFEHEPIYEAGKTAALKKLDSASKLNSLERNIHRRFLSTRLPGLLLSETKLLSSNEGK